MFHKPLIQHRFTSAPSLRIRSNFEQLISEIVLAVNPKDPVDLARRIAIAARTNKWTEQDLHALLAKKKDPKIRNFAGFVNWSIKVKTATESAEK